MALPICLEIPELGDPPVITLPGGVSIQQFNLMEAIQPALTPLMPVFDIIDTVVAVFNCVKAIPDSLGPPPDPTALAACIPELAEKVSKLLKLIPQLSLPYTIIGIIDLVIDTLRQARDQLLHLQQQMGCGIAHLQPHLPLLGELDGIAQQVEQDLLQPQRVAAQVVRLGLGVVQQ